MVSDAPHPHELAELTGTLASSSDYIVEGAPPVVEAKCARALLGDHDVTRGNRDPDHFVKRVRLVVPHTHQGH